MAAKTKWEWGRSPAPRDWREAADALKTHQTKPKKESLRELIERLAKDKKNA